MAVGFAGIETVDASLVDFGYKGGADASFLKLSDDIIRTVVAESVIDFIGACIAVSGADHSQSKSILFGNTGNLIEIYKLRLIGQISGSEVKEEEYRTADALLPGLNECQIIVIIQYGNRIRGSTTISSKS